MASPFYAGPPPAAFLASVAQGQERAKSRNAELSAAMAKVWNSRQREWAQGLQRAADHGTKVNAPDLSRARKILGLPESAAAPPAQSVEGPPRQQPAANMSVYRQPAPPASSSPPAPPSVSPTPQRAPLQPAGGAQVAPQPAARSIADQQAREAANTSFASAWNEAMKAYAGTPGMKVTPAYTFGGQGIGNLAYASQRPEAFSSQMTGFGGQPVQPSQYMAQRDAFIQRLNEERGRQAAQSGVYYPNEIPKFYQPSRDFDALWKQAGDMVQDGWTNPLAGLFS